MLHQLATQYQFTYEELITIKGRFDKLCEKGLMTKHQFRDSLGILGLEQFLADRIFNLLDQNKDNLINFEDFVRYLNMLLNGTSIEKALWSFKMLSNNKGVLEIEDMEKMIFEMCYLWNSITGSKSMPKKELVEEIFSIFDTDEDGIVQFEEFRTIYQQGVELIGWYEFLNNEDITTNKIKEEWENMLKSKKKKRMTIINRQSLDHTQELDGQLKHLQTELLNCSELIKLENSRQSQQKQVNFLQSFYLDERCIKTHGPLFNEGQAQQVLGDDEDPEQDQPNWKQQFTQQPLNQDHFQHNMMSRLRYILQLTEEIKQVNSQQAQQIVPERSVIKKNTKSLSPISLDETIPLSPDKKNLSIYFGHENWNLVLNMMIGIRKAIKSLHPLTDDIVITSNHFALKINLRLFQNEHKEFDCKKSCQFYEYAPLIFERIRKMYYITNDDFLRSIGPEQLLGDLVFGNLASLTEKVSSGKSGSFFYYSFDDKYMLKTIPKEEFLFFKKLIKSYYYHLQENYHSMMIKIFGLYQIKVHKAKDKHQKMYFVVMSNIFCTNLEFSFRFDLKGSLYQRSSRVKNKQVDPIVPLKDLDWLEDKQSIQLDSKTQEIFKMQILKDVNFFRENKIIDYSFLIGIVQDCKFTEQTQQTRFNERYHGGCLSRDGNKLYYFGIIDIFTEYNNRKQLEHKVKSTFVSKDVSCIPPDNYADRFIKFIMSSLS